MDGRIDKRGFLSVLLLLNERCVQDLEINQGQQTNFPRVQCLFFDSYGLAVGTEVCVAKAQLLTNNKSTHVVSRYVCSAGEKQLQLRWGQTVQASTRRRIRKWSTALYQSESDT